ncbi:MAG: class I SAM-dependent methyltransferase [Candidatus Tectomicrobia bacterium]|uniref:Class I SAM-dependent methyltransferase n=1 Tax=Tectimicrobiota bacterium TaxID=2528274 RepID=A0A937W5W6_UNCTE|nr:class I SAM-dependent methyltransferase [Candidatus Tectomicrobia bacterium]
MKALRESLEMVAQQEARAYQRQRYRSLDQTLVNWREQQIMEELLTSCQLQGSSLLDVPCGYGRFTALFARLGIQATGADMHDGMVRLAREQQTPPGRGRWLRTDILALPFADATFDCVTCIRLLHHRNNLEVRAQMLRELARVSRRFVLVSFYNTTPLHSLARHWRGTRSRLAMMTDTQFHDIAAQSQLYTWQQRFLWRFCHAQTFVLLTKGA